MFLGGMYPRGGISYSLLMENRNFETFFFVILFLLEKIDLFLSCPSLGKLLYQEYLNR